MPNEAKFSPSFHEVSPATLPPHSFCQTLFPIRSASACESVRAEIFVTPAAHKKKNSAIPSEGTASPPSRAECRDETLKVFRTILRLRFAPLGMTASRAPSFALLDGRYLSISVQLSALRFKAQPQLQIHFYEKPCPRSRCARAGHASCRARKNAVQRYEG